MEFLQVFAEKIVEYTVVAVACHLGYLIYYRSYFNNLRTQVEELDEARKRVQLDVDAATRNAEVIETNVLNWLNRVNPIATEAEKFFEDEAQAKKTCCNGWFPNLNSRYQLSKRAYKMALVIKEITDEGIFDRVSYRVFTNGIGTAKSSRIYEAFESRISTVRQVMEALTDANINKIGVYGMGGVGKTMLVEEVARQAMVDKLFDKVVMTVVSQTPDFKKIQGEVGDKLHLIFDEESVSGRADRLRNRLKQEKKILIIIDDIWETIGLEDLGISFGDDQKGCKVLLTSRFQDVVCSAMDTQKSFPVGVLSENEARYLFGKIVGDSAETLDFQLAAAVIVKECAGLPIAISTVANSLKNKSLFFWEDALQQLKRCSPTNIKGMHKNVYSTIELSYNFLESEEEKSLFLICSLHAEDEDINIDDLLRYGVGLGLFPGIYETKKVRNRVHTVVENLKASCLLLDGKRSGTVKMHDVIRDVAIYIAAKDKRMFTVGSAVDLEEWSKRKIELKDSTAISLPHTDVKELPERLECPQLELFLLLNGNSSLQIPDLFFERVKELRVLYLTEICLPQLPLSLLFLHNLQTLCLDGCELEALDMIGELKNLRVLSLSRSNIERLPKEIGELTHLQLLDLENCSTLNVIPPDVLSNLHSLEELYMRKSFNQWEVEEQSSEESNPRVSELDHLSHLTMLDIHIPNAQILPKAKCFRELVRYKILIGHDWHWYGEFRTSRTLKLKLLNRSFQSEDGIKTLFKSCQDLCLCELKSVYYILYEDCDGFPQLMYLSIKNNAEIQYIIRSIGFQRIAFPLLESISLEYVTNLEKIGHGQLAVGSFANLRMVKVKCCDNLRFVFLSSVAGCLSKLQEMEVSECEVMSAIVLKEREDEIEFNDNNTTNIMEFVQLLSLDLRDLPELMGFCSDIDVDSHLLFNEKVAFPNLERMNIHKINNLKMIWHDQLAPNSFCKLKEMYVTWCENITNIFPPDMLTRLQNLEKLDISNCCLVEVVFVIEGTNVEETGDIIGTQLKFLKLNDLSKVKHIWSMDPQGVLTFQNLQSVEIRRCDGLKSVFPTSVAKHLVKLEKLDICDCGVEEIVAEEEGSDTVTKFVFPRMNSLRLQNLPKLGCFYPGIHTSEWPSLKELAIYNCNSVKIFGLGVHGIPIQQPLFLIDKDTFPNLEKLKLDSDDTMTKTCGRFPAELFCKLEVLELTGDFFEEIGQCGILGEEVQHAGTLEHLTVLKLSKMTNLMHLLKENYQVSRAFQNLQILEVSECGGLKNLVPSSISFQNLETLEVWKCHGLTNLVMSSTAKSLVQLRKMVIVGCEKMTEIVGNEGVEAGEEIISFSQLKSLELRCLHTLTSFHLGNCTIEFPCLEQMSMTECPRLKIFSNGVSRTPKLKMVNLAKKYEWRWRGKPVTQMHELCKNELNSTIRQFWEDNFDSCNQ